MSRDSWTRFLCRALPCTATTCHCCALPCPAAHCRALPLPYNCHAFSLPRTAVHCHALPCTAVPCRALPLPLPGSKSHVLALFWAGLFDQGAPRTQSPSSSRKSSPLAGPKECCFRRIATKEFSGRRWQQGVPMGQLAPRSSSEARRSSCAASSKELCRGRHCTCCSNTIHAYCTPCVLLSGLLA